MDRYAVWRRGSRLRGSPGTTVNRLMPGGVFSKALKNFFFFFLKTTFLLSVIEWYMTTKLEPFFCLLFCFSLVYTDWAKLGKVMSYIPAPIRI